MAVFSVASAGELKHNPIPVSSLIMSPATTSSSLSVMGSRNLGPTQENTHGNPYSNNNKQCGDEDCTT